VQNKIDLNGATRIVRVNSTSAARSPRSRATSAPAAARPASPRPAPARSSSPAANTYNGPTTISGGTLTHQQYLHLHQHQRHHLAPVPGWRSPPPTPAWPSWSAGGGVPFGTFLRYSSGPDRGGLRQRPRHNLGTVEINLTNVNPDYTLDFGSGLHVPEPGHRDLCLARHAFRAMPRSTPAPQVFTLNSGGHHRLHRRCQNPFPDRHQHRCQHHQQRHRQRQRHHRRDQDRHGRLDAHRREHLQRRDHRQRRHTDLSGADGSIGSSAVTVAGGTLTVSNTGAANNGDRLSNSAAFTMNGGTFNFNNTASAFDYSESAGTLTLVGGANTVAIQQAAVARPPRSPSPGSRARRARSTSPAPAWAPPRIRAARSPSPARPRSPMASSARGPRSTARITPP
jgi:hypothetical protein